MSLPRTLCVPTERGILMAVVTSKIFHEWFLVSYGLSCFLQILDGCQIRQANTFTHCE